MIRASLLALALIAVPGLPLAGFSAHGLSGMAQAQDRAQTLADIKAELATLNGTFTALKQELVTTGALQSGAAGGSALQRMDAIEAALARLTAQAEQIELRLNRVVADGTNRLGDLEFRVVELEGGDIGALPPTQPLGGAPAETGGTATAPLSQPPVATGPELAIGEQADFDRAREVLGQGDFRGAADLFATFAQSYPGSPLMAQAQILRGDALAQAGDRTGAARSWLEAFSSQPDGPHAAEALVKLGQGLADLGQHSEACVTLREVGIRFPGSPSAADAAGKVATLACP